MNENREPLSLVAKLCADSTCPAVYRNAGGALVVQGYVVDASSAGVDVPDGECLVEIPVDLLVEAARTLTSPPT